MTAFMTACLLLAGPHDVCVPPVEELPVLVTYYDPLTCITPDGTIEVNINCDSDPTRFADGTAVSSANYGNTAACIPEWLGREITLEGVGTVTCRDTGGSIAVVYNDYYGRWVIHVDMMLPEEPSFNYWLVDWN